MISDDDQLLLPKVVRAVGDAAALLRKRFSQSARPSTAAELMAALTANDEASLSVLRPALLAARPDARWVDDEEDAGPLPSGEWWVADAVEGNINHVHGLPDWGVTATLIRDNQPVLTAVQMPLAARSYWATRGQGAFENGQRLQVSQKTELRAALVGTGQARPFEDSHTHRRIGESVIAMLGVSLLARVSVPPTMQLLEVAAGRLDVFWQFSQVRSGLVAGALLVEEAGGLVTDVRGDRWGLSSRDFVAAAPGLHRATIERLSSVG